MIVNPLSVRKMWCKYSLPLGLLLLTYFSGVHATDRHEGLLTLPVRVHLMSFEAAETLNSTFEAPQVERLFTDVNALWKQWGIEWQLESIVYTRVSAAQFPSIAIDEGRKSFREKLVAISPKIGQKRLWQVCLIRRFPIPASGVYLRETGTVFYGELNKHGESQPVVLAHELGHSLGLDHVPDASNLMQGGSSKNPSLTTNLDAVQIRAAKVQANHGPVAGARLDDERKLAIVRRLRQMDRNGDGVVVRAEVAPPARKAFELLDYDRNGALDDEEFDHFLGVYRLE